VLEGAKVITEALDADAALEDLYVAPGTQDPVVQRAARAGIAVHVLAAGVMERVTDTVTPQPVVAIASWPAVTIETLADADFVVVCVDVRDPGNLGTVLRTAEASGASGVVCCDGSADISAPKVVRSSAGSLFHIPVVSGGNPVEVMERLGTWGLCRLGTSAHEGVCYDGADLRGRVAVVLGNEAWGLPAELAEQLDLTVTIPMSGRTESLNVGMAASVLCFEVTRQRRAAGAGR